MICWHRPSKQIRSSYVTCRHCGVVIEECPCVPAGARKVDDKCPACLGSGYVAFVRSRYARYREALLELV
jgi:hypothetical protein